MRLISASRSDNVATVSAARHCYRRLLRNRVKIYEYQPQMLHVKLIVAPWNELPDRLRSREIDLMVADLRSIRTMDEFETMNLAPHPTRLVCRADHPLMHLDHVRIEDLLRYPLAGPQLTDDDMESVLPLIPASFRARLRRKGLLTIVSDSAPVLSTLVQQSDCLALLYLFLVESELRNGRVRIIPGVEVKPGPGLGVARLRNRTLARPAKAFLDALVEYDAELAQRDAALLKHVASAKSGGNRRKSRGSRRR